MQSVEAVLPPREQTPRESYRPGDRIVALGDVPVALGTSVEAFASAVADERARQSAHGQLCVTFERDTCQML